MSIADGWLALTPERVREILEQIRTGPAPAPEIAGLFYRGRTHGLPGKRDAGKSLVMALIAIDVLAAGGSVLWIDHEVGAQLVLRRLVELGGDEDVIAERFHLVDDARGLAPPEAIEAFAGVDLVVLDAMTGQMSRAGLDDNSAVDVDQVYDTICKPLAHKHGACVVVIDHVPHGDSGRPLGSQRKSSAPDVELLLTPVRPFKPGLGGRAKVTVGRDRLGRIQPAEIVLEPDGSWRVESAGTFKPTVLMRRVSEYLAVQAEPVSKRTIETDVQGAGQHLRNAVDELVRDGFAAIVDGGYAHVRPYEDPPESRGSSGASSVRRDEGSSGSSSPKHRDDPVVDATHLLERGASSPDDEPELAW